MKTSTQVHRNGSAPRAKKQVAKTSDPLTVGPRAPVPTREESVFKFVSDRPHKWLVSFALGLFDDPKARPIFAEWFCSIPKVVLVNLVAFLFRIVPSKAAGDGEHGGPGQGTAAETESAVTPLDSVAQPIIPSHAALRFQAAMGRLRIEAEVAGAIAMMAADVLQTQMEECGGWEELEAMPGFAKGVAELARSTSVELVHAVSRFGAGHEWLIGRADAVKSPVVNHRLDYDTGRALLSSCGWRAPESPALETDLEDTVGKMSQFLGLLPPMMERPPRNQEIFRLTQDADEKLGAAFSEAWDARIELIGAVVALEFSRQSEQRQAA